MCLISFAGYLITQHGHPSQLHLGFRPENLTLAMPGSQPENVLTRVERSAVVVAIAALVLAAGCRQGKYCPSGYDTQPAGDVGVWCRQRGGGDALYIMFHPGGRQARMHCRFVNGVPSGAFESWHPNGKPEVKGQYRDGRKQGKWLQTDQFGGKLADGEYRSGTLVAGAPVGLASLCESLKP
jgi:hypothetical protein